MSEAAPRYPANQERLPRAREVVHQLAMRYGSIKQAGIAYDERYSRNKGTGERLMLRINGSKFGVGVHSLDRLEVLLWS